MVLGGRLYVPFWDEKSFEQSVDLLVRRIAEVSAMGSDRDEPDLDAGEHRGRMRTSSSARADSDSSNLEGRPSAMFAQVAELSARDVDEELAEFARERRFAVAWGLGHQPLQDRGGELVVRCLAAEPTACTTLILSKTGLTDATGLRLAELLRSTGSLALEVLNLSDNLLTDVSASQVLDALKANTTLRQLFLTTNKDIGADETTIREAAQLLTHNSCLELICLGNNKIKSCPSELRDALFINSALQLLYLGGNPLNKSSIQLLSNPENVSRYHLQDLFLTLPSKARRSCRIAKRAKRALEKARPAGTCTVHF